MILIIGSEGSMGKRYQAILKYLAQEFACYDVKFHNVADFYRLCSEATGFIVASPTPTHYNILLQLMHMQKPILCEKPVVTSEWELRDIMALARRHNTYLRMVRQYGFLMKRTLQKKDKGSYYDYFRTGNDGLIWDCMQIIIHHEGPWENLELKNESPLWECAINGQRLNIGDMDYAYVLNTAHFLKETNHLRQESVIVRDQVAENYLREITEHHDKVHSYIKFQEEKCKK